MIKIFLATDRSRIQASAVSVQTFIIECPGRTKLKPNNSAFKRADYSCHYLLMSLLLSFNSSSYIKAIGFAVSLLFPLLFSVGIASLMFWLVSTF